MSFLIPESDVDADLEMWGQHVSNGFPCGKWGRVHDSEPSPRVTKFLMNPNSHLRLWSLVVTEGHVRSRMVTYGHLWSLMVTYSDS